MDGEEEWESGCSFPTGVQFGCSVSAFTGGVVKVKELDWLKDDLCTGLCFLWCPSVQWLLCGLAAPPAPSLVEGSLPRLLNPSCSLNTCHMLGLWPHDAAHTSQGHRGGISSEWEYRAALRGAILSPSGVCHKALTSGA